MQAGLLYPQRTLAKIQKSGPSLLFNLNQFANTAPVPNLANINKTIVGTYTNSPSRAQFIRNVPGVKFAQVSSQECSFGNVLNFTDRITIFFLFRRDATSASIFPMVFGKCANTAYYFIMNGTTNRMAFNIGSSGGEKSSGYPALALRNGDWYWGFGSYDKDAGGNNLRINVYTVDGRLYATSASAQTLAISTNAQALSINRDALRGHYDNVSGAIGGVCNRQMSMNEELEIVKSFLNPGYARQMRGFIN